MRRFSAFGLLAVLLLVSLVVAPSWSFAHQALENESGEILLVGEGSKFSSLVTSGSADDDGDSSPFLFPFPPDKPQPEPPFSRPPPLASPPPVKPVAPPSPHFPPHFPAPPPEWPKPEPPVKPVAPPSPHFPPHFPAPPPEWPKPIPPVRPVAPPSPHFPPHFPPASPPEWPKPVPPFEPPPHFPPAPAPSPPPHHLPKAVLAHLDISPGKLSPQFSPDHFNYSASVKSKVKKIRITAVVPKEQEKAEYTITVNSIPIKSGVPSPQLRVGKAGKDVQFEILVTALEHEPSTYYLVVHRGKSKWDKFGYKFLLALAIILVIAVVGLLCYGCYVCWKSGRMQTMWPFKRSETSEYSALGSGPSGTGRP